MMRASLRFIGALVLSAALAPSLASSNADCYEAIRSHLAANDPAAAKKFFQLQAKLTLHRLAWAHLNAVRSGKGQAFPSLQKTIQDTLSSLEDSRKDEAFRKAEKTFQEAPLSRHALAEVMESLRKTLEGQKDLPESARAFQLHLEDVRMLAILGETEASATNAAGRFIRDPKDPRSVLNLLKLVDSAYRNQDRADLDREIRTVKSEIDRIEKSLASYAEKVLQIARENPACQESFECPDCAAGEDPVRRQSQALDLLLRSLNEDLKKNHYSGVRFGDVWLRTARRPGGGKVSVASSSGGTLSIQPVPAKASPPSVPVPPTSGKRPLSPYDLEYAFDPGKTEASFRKNEEERKKNPALPAASPLEGQSWDEIRVSLEGLNAVRGCIARDFPTFAGSYGPTARAFALYRAESARARLDEGAFKNLVRYFSGPLKVSPNPYREKPELCSELARLDKSTRNAAIEALGAVRYWSANAAQSPVRACSDLREEEKLFLQILIATRHLKESQVRDCQISASIRGGLATYRTFADGIFTLPVNR